MNMPRKELFLWASYMQSSYRARGNLKQTFRQAGVGLGWPSLVRSPLLQRKSSCEPAAHWTDRLPGKYPPLSLVLFMLPRHEVCFRALPVVLMHGWGRFDRSVGVGWRGGSFSQGSLELDDGLVCRRRRCGALCRVANGLCKPGDLLIRPHYTPPSLPPSLPLSE